LRGGAFIFIFITNPPAGLVPAGAGAAGDAARYGALIETDYGLGQADSLRL